MKCCGKERSTSYWVKRAIFIPIAVAAGVFVFGSVVMLLWNSLLPAIFGLGTITFWQAIGMLVLAKIFFGGFHGGHGHCKCHHHHMGHGKWMQLDPGQREKLKEEWKGRCCSGEQAE